MEGGRKKKKEVEKEEGGAGTGHDHLKSNGGGKRKGTGRVGGKRRVINTKRHREGGRSLHRQAEEEVK